MRDRRRSCLGEVYLPPAAARNVGDGSLRRGFGDHRGKLVLVEWFWQAEQIAVTARRQLGIAGGKDDRQVGLALGDRRGEFEPVILGIA